MDLMDAILAAKLSNSESGAGAGEKRVTVSGTSPEIAAEKHYESAVAGDADILLADNVHMGNVLGKCLTVTCGAKMAGFVVGTVCPVVMTSRGSSAEEKYNSIVLAARIAR